MPAPKPSILEFPSAAKFRLNDLEIAYPSKCGRFEGFWVFGIGFSTAMSNYLLSQLLFLTLQR